MGSSSSQRTNLSASYPKLDVDNRISLPLYFQIADNILDLAEKYREEKNIFELYESLLRFSSLASETIPYHQGYRAFDKLKQDSLKKKLLNALCELERLKPAVKQLNEKSDARLNLVRRRYLQQVGTLERLKPAVKQLNETSDARLNLLTRRYHQQVGTLERLKPAVKQLNETSDARLNLLTWRYHQQVGTLERLKPAVKQLNETSDALLNLVTRRYLQQVGTPSFPVRTKIRDSNSFPEKHTIFRPLSVPNQEFKYQFGLPNQEKKETGSELLPRNEHDWQQSQWFSSAREGIQEMHPTINVPSAPSAEEDLELVMAINASIQSASQERRCFSDALSTHQTSASCIFSGSSGQESAPSRTSALQRTATSDPIPSSPLAPTTNSSSCVICLDGPVEGAFIPCGHMSGCMPCLKEIKAKNWDCPVCRGKVDQVIRIYPV